MGNPLLSLNRLVRASVGLGPLEKFGRNITSQDSDHIVRRITGLRPYLGRGKEWQRDFVHTLERWLSGAADYAEIDHQLVSLSETHQGTRAQTFFAAQVAGALGYFSASLRFEKLALDRAIKLQMGRSRLTQALSALQVAIHRGDSELALGVMATLQQHLHGSKNIPESVREIVQYVQAWVGTESPEKNQIEFSDQANGRWLETISHQSLVVYGPGRTDDTEGTIPPEKLVIRVAGPGSFQWGATSDLAGGRTDIVYMNPELLTSILEGGKQNADILGDYSFVCVKRHQTSILPNARRVDSGGRLFLRGHPNMIPLIIVDLIKIPGTQVHVIGSDFFASPLAYRLDSLRATPIGSKQTEQGSTGNLYDRCTLFASHNVFQNRRLVANLVASGRISGDANFMEACRISDEEYAHRLDLNYGQHRI